VPFLQKLLIAFFMCGVSDTGIYRADLNAFGFRKPANALSAFIGVNNVSVLALLDGFIFTFRFAGTTADAVIGNFVRHF
jgi:hypothetical protein